MPGDRQDEIDINDSWADYYFKNKQTSKWKMSKPTVQQINESDLDEQEKYQLLQELGLIIETDG